MINYDTERGGVEVDIDTGPPRSRLTVSDARASDSGNYTCMAANTASASIMVYITEGNFYQFFCILDFLLIMRHLSAAMGV